MAQYFENVQPQRHEGTKDYNIILLMPFLIRGMLKLIKKSG